MIARFRREETQLFILRVMVALIILYDHVHPVGAFVKASTVDVSDGGGMVEWGASLRQDRGEVGVMQLRQERGRMDEVRVVAFSTEIRLK